MLKKDPHKEEPHLISDVAKAINVSVKTIKNWEDRGHIPKPRRDPIRNWRIYTEEEIAQLVERAKRNNYFREINISNVESLNR